MLQRFEDRLSAGRYLADKLTRYRGLPQTIVLALPRGGVPVGFEIATRLSLPMDVYVVRKLGVPHQPELAMGAIASNFVRVLNEPLIEHLQIPRHDIDAITRREQEEITRRLALYRPGSEPLSLNDKTVLLVDDGIATGSSIRAAIQALRQSNVARMVVAVPVAPPDTYATLEKEADEIVCGMTPEPFQAVGMWYDRFTQISDDQVRHWLDEAAKKLPASPA